MSPVSDRGRTIDNMEYSEKEILKNKKGIVLLITIIILGALLAAALGVASVFIKETQISALVDDSLIAILAADAGLEKMLYNVRILGGSSTTSFNTDLSNGASYITCENPTTCSDSLFIFTSTGAFSNARRTLEASLAP